MTITAATGNVHLATHISTKEVFMVYVLVMVLTTMQGEAIHTQEFFSKSRCNDAREVMKQQAPSVRTFCVLK